MKIVHFSQGFYALNAKIVSIYLMIPVLQNVQERTLSVKHLTSSMETVILASMDTLFNRDTVSLLLLIVQIQTSTPN